MENLKDNLNYWCPIKNWAKPTEKRTNLSASPQRFVILHLRQTKIQILWTKVQFSPDSLSKRVNPTKHYVMDSIRISLFSQKLMALCAIRKKGKKKANPSLAKTSMPSRNRYRWPSTNGAISHIGGVIIWDEN